MKLPQKILWFLAFAAGPGLLPAAPLAPPPDERFGVMTHFAQGWDPALIPLIAAGGIAQVRDELYWASVEAEKGVFKFSAAYDRYLDGLAQHDISPLIVLSFENHHYDGGATPYTAEGFAAYARYAVEVLRHGGPRVKAVEIWNEYNGTFNHGPASEDRARTYLAMLRVVYAAIKQERPDVIVLGGATAGVPLPYWEKLLAGGGLDAMDALSVHPYHYASPPEEGLEDDIAGLQALVRRYHSGATKPIWVTEIGWQLKPATAPGDLVIDEAVQAKFLVRAYALLLAADVPRIYWYLFRDDGPFTMGLVRNDAARSPKPAYHALATLIRQLRGARFLRREATPADLYSLVFRRPGGEEVRVLWSLSPRQLKLTGATGAADLAGRPVKLAAALTLDDSPLFVTGALRGLPPAPPAQGKVLADAVRDFSGTQTGPWSYGAFAGDTVFRPLPHYEVTDWKAMWTGEFPYIYITAGEQHPSVLDQRPVAAVRRWTAPAAGTVRISGSFRCGTDGDGVGVALFVDGQRRWRKLLGGGAAVVENFDLVETVRAGTTIDFAVDPGPAASIDYDVTAVAIMIKSER